MNPILFDIEVIHPGCWCIDTSARIEHTIREGHSLNVTNGKITVETEITGSGVNQVIKKIEAHPIVKRVDVKFHVGDTTRFYVTSLYDPTIMKRVVASGCSYLGECITENGVDKIMLVAPSMENFKTFCNSVDENTEIVLKSRKNLEEKDITSMKSFNASGFFKIRNAKEMLSEKQKEIFDLACKRGYYNFPKRLTLEELARSVGLSESTTREHLRRAEAKIYPVMSDLIRLA